MQNSRKALSGIKVIELSSFISGPYCSKLMADLGAEIVKVEEPNVGDRSRRYGPFPGDIPHIERSGMFQYLNSNKLGITLNIKTGTGCEIIRKLLKEADIFVENNSPRFMKKVGLDYNTVKKINPKIIMPSITAYGQTGAYKDNRGYAINASALGGMSLCTGEQGREPLTPPLSLGNFQAGVAGAVGALFALFARRKNKKGQQVDVAEADVWAICHNGHMMAGYIMAGMKRMRWGHRWPSVYPATILPCKDGDMFLCCLRTSEWKEFLKIMGKGKLPEWYSKVPKFADRRELVQKYGDEMDALLAPWLKAHTREEIYKLCRQKLTFAPVNTAKELLRDQHLKERQFLLKYNNKETSTWEYPGAPYKLSESPWQIERPAPLLGEHNEFIYCRRLGLSEEEVGVLGKQGII